MRSSCSCFWSSPVYTSTVAQAEIFTRIERPNGRVVGTLPSRHRAYQTIVLMNLFSYRRSAFHVGNYSTLIGAGYELSRTCINASTGKKPAQGFMVNSKLKLHKSSGVQIININREGKPPRLHTPPKWLNRGRRHLRVAPEMLCAHCISLVIKGTWGW